MKLLFRVVLVGCWLLAGAAFVWAALYKNPDGVYCTYTAGTDLAANWSVNGAPCHIKGTFYFLAIAFAFAFGTGATLTLSFVYLHAEQFLRRLLGRN